MKTLQSLLSIKPICNLSPETKCLMTLYFTVSVKINLGQHVISCPLHLVVTGSRCWAGSYLARDLLMFRSEPWQKQHLATKCCSPRKDDLTQSGNELSKLINMTRKISSAFYCSKWDYFLHQNHHEKIFHAHIVLLFF